MKPTKAVHHGDATAAALIDSVGRWRREYAPGSSTESVVTELTKAITVTLKVRYNVPLSITVQFDGVRRQTSDVYYYEATLSGGQLKLETIFD